MIEDLNSYIENNLEKSVIIGEPICLIGNGKDGKNPEYKYREKQTLGEKPHQEQVN